MVESEGREVAVKRAMIVAIAILLNGCTGVKAIGVWVENDDTTNSFALSWHRDKDPNYRAPDPEKEIAVGIPTWMRP